MSITSEELENIMSYATGTESYTRYGLFNKILLTDGVVMFAEKAGCFWFLDEVTLMLKKMFQKAPNEYLFTITLKVKNEKARIIVTDGDCKKLIEKRIAFTDCPSGDWKFFFDKDANVMLYHSEY